MKTRPQNTVSSARDSLRRSSLHDLRMTRLFCLKCFFSKSVRVVRGAVVRKYNYLDIPFSSRLKIVKNCTTTNYCLTVKELFDEPEDQPRFTLFWSGSGKGSNCLNFGAISGD